MQLGLITTTKGTPARMTLKAWKPGQDMRLVRRNAFRLVKEFKLKPGECVVVTNGKWSSDSDRRWCLVIQTRELIPVIMYMPTVKVTIVQNLSMQLYDFLKLWVQARKRTGR